MEDTCLETLKRSLVSYCAALREEETALEVDAEASAGADRLGFLDCFDP